MAVNLRGAYFLARAVARGLVAAGRPGSIITLSSQMGVVGGPERAVYCGWARCRTSWVPARSSPARP